MNNRPSPLLCASASHSVLDTADGFGAGKAGYGGQEEKAERRI